MLMNQSFTYELDVLVSSSLVDMYIKCGNIGDAWRVFNKTTTCNIICWNAMILGHVKCGRAHKVLELFLYMQYEGWSQSLSSLWGC